MTLATTKAVLAFETDDEGCLRAIGTTGVSPGEGRAGWEAGTFLRDHRMRGEGARLVEQGELPLLLAPDSPGAEELPLCFVDYSLLERGGGVGCVSVEHGAWNDACRLVGMHAVLFGVGQGLNADDIEKQYMAWARWGLSPDRP